MADELSDIIDKITLKQCPFCGRRATIVMHPGTNWDGSADKSVNIGAMHGLWWVGCSYPFFEDMGIIERNGEMCHITPAAKWFANLGEAIRIWNGVNQKQD